MPALVAVSPQLAAVVARYARLADQVKPTAMSPTFTMFVLCKSFFHL
jgi:hypothetical protein